MSAGIATSARLADADSTLVARQAEVWLGKLERTLRREETAELRAWLATPLHREVIVDQCKIWHGPEVLAVLSALVPVRKRAQVSTAWQAHLVLGIMIVFAGLGFFLAAWRLWVAPGAAVRVEDDYRTAAGERREIALPDGTTVTLHTASRVLIFYGPRSRDATLLRGAASFDVTQDADRPFRISAGPRVLVADGPGRFDLRRRSQDEIELIVSSGRVRALASRAGALTPAQRRARLSFGERTFEAREGGVLGAGWHRVQSVNRQVRHADGITRHPDENRDLAHRLSSR